MQPYIESFTALSDVNTMQAQIQRISKAYLCKDYKNVIPAIKITNSALDYEKKILLKMVQLSRGEGL